MEGRGRPPASGGCYWGGAPGRLTPPMGRKRSNSFRHQGFIVWIPSEAAVAVLIFILTDASVAFSYFSLYPAVKSVEIFGFISRLNTAFLLSADVGPRRDQSCSPAAENREPGHFPCLGAPSAQLQQPNRSISFLWASIDGGAGWTAFGQGLGKEGGCMASGLCRTTLVVLRRARTGLSRSPGVCRSVLERDGEPAAAVDESAALTAQCARLIGAAALWHRLPPALSLKCFFNLGGRRGDSTWLDSALPF